MKQQQNSSQSDAAIDCRQQQLQVIYQCTHEDFKGQASDRWPRQHHNKPTLFVLEGGITTLKLLEDLTDEQIVGCCEAAERAGADFVKTSTGFHPAGGASEHAVALMAQTVGGRLGVKASGGIRTAAAALAMIDAGDFAGGFAPEFQAGD